MFQLVSYDDRARFQKVLSDGESGPSSAPK